MKKSATIALILGMTLSINAQSLKVQDAMTNLKRGYLNKAKEDIDKACQHEATKDDPKTWYYAALIYSQIGDAVSNPKSKYKNLDPNWSTKAYEAALNCKRLDKNNDYEYKNIFLYLGNNYYKRSISAFNEGDYLLSLSLSDTAITNFNNAGTEEAKEFANESYYIAGYSCQMLKDNEGVKKYYSPLVRKTKHSKTMISRMPDVYRTMFHVYKQASDTVNVMKIANNYIKALPDDPNAQLLMADAYIWTGNPTKGISLANQAAESTKKADETNGTNNYPVILCAVAGVYENAQDYEGAEARYKESATIMPNQIGANYGMGIMLYNRAVDKIKALDNEDLYLSDDNEALINKLTEEYKSLFQQAIPYFLQSINYIDALDDEHKAQNRSHLYNSLKALNTCYVRMEMYNESKPIQERITQMEKSN